MIKRLPFSALCLANATILKLPIKPYCTSYCCRSLAELEIDR